MKYSLLLTLSIPLVSALSFSEADGGEASAWKKIAEVRLVSQFPPLKGTFSPGGGEFALATGDQIQRWRVQDWSASKSIEEPGALSCVYLSDTRLAVCLVKIGSTDPRIITHDLATGSVLDRQTISGMISTPAFATSKALVAFSKRSEKGSNVELLGTSNWKPIRSLGNQLNEITAVEFSPNGELLATGSADARLILWQTGSGKPIGEFYVSPEKRFASYGQIDCLAFSPDGTWIASGGDGSSTVRVWDTKTGSVIRELTLWPEHDQVHGLAFSPDGTRFAAASGKKIVVLSCDQWREEIVLARRPSAGGFYSPIFSPDGRRFIFVEYSGKGDNYTLAVWDSE